ncbi:hypothetical protein PTTG_11676 [Puccinia triticina 1-1 BBBD Race 1]|uniref:Integrase_H2C2 domain-containing protein n=1 Tax=Puccinia triticina (isolate 1-1 / race 1 (BBBD)) TaxID=630390 RepID=A0A180GAP5_PUCT1|nr:hypothetical protein PTTG_11676 [Puccinia triticina 1-1 BBBD Race 1]
MTTGQPRSPRILAFLSDQLRQRICDGYTVDPFYKELRSTPRLWSGCTEIKGLVFVGRCLFLPADPVLRLKLIEQVHRWLGHANALETIGKLRRGFVWRGMNTEVKIFAQTCPNCRQAKGVEAAATIDSWSAPSPLGGTANDRTSPISSSDTVGDLFSPLSPTRTISHSASATSDPTLPPASQLYENQDLSTVQLTLPAWSGVSPPPLQSKLHLQYRLPPLKPPNLKGQRSTVRPPSIPTNQTSSPAVETSRRDLKPEDSLNSLDRCLAQIRQLLGHRLDWLLTNNDSTRQGEWICPDGPPAQPSIPSYPSLCTTPSSLPHPIPTSPNSPPPSSQLIASLPPYSLPSTFAPGSPTTFAAPPLRQTQFKAPAPSVLALSPGPPSPPFQFFPAAAFFPIFFPSVFTVPLCLSSSFIGGETVNPPPPLGFTRCHQWTPALSQTCR